MEEKKCQWLMYDCQFCGRAMKIIKQRQNSNDAGQHYINTVYRCNTCDFTMTSKIPRAIALTIVDERCLPPVALESQTC